MNNPIKIFAGEMFDGPRVTEVKGIRSGREWLAQQIEKSLVYRADMTLSIDWSLSDIPQQLRKRIILVQRAAV